MTNPYRSPDPLNDPISPPTPSARRMRRAGRLFIVLGVVALLLGSLRTVWSMVQSFNSLAQSPSTPRPENLAGDLSASISVAVVVTTVGIAAAAILLPLGIVLLVQAARARRRQEE